MLLGSIAFVRIFKYVLERWENNVMLAMAGLMLASWRILRPWKYQQDNNRQEENISPCLYSDHVAQDAFVWQSMLAFGVGIGIVFALTVINKASRHNND